jgi:hypothetical protein
LIGDPRQQFTLSGFCGVLDSPGALVAVGRNIADAAYLSHGNPVDVRDMCYSCPFHVLDCSARTQFNFNGRRPGAGTCRHSNEIDATLGREQLHWQLIEKGRRRTGDHGNIQRLHIQKTRWTLRSQIPVDFNFGTGDVTNA